MAEPQSIPADPLADLIDIPPPPAVSLWPQTWASRIAVVVLVSALLALTAWMVHRWWVNRYRREALAALDRLAQAPGEPEQIAPKLALLVRRTALAAFPRERIAGLTGSAWLAFLDRSYGGTEFSQGVGSTIEAEAYAPAQAVANPSPTIDLVRRWIKVHHA